MKTIHFFAGHADGDKAEVEAGIVRLSVPTPKGSRGKFTIYELSSEWSEHFKRETFVPIHHPGRPRELQTA